MYYQRRITLAALPSAAYWARRHLEIVLNDWHAGIDVASAKLVVTELVVNAVKVSNTLTETEQAAYADYPGDASYSTLARLGYVRLRLAYGEGRLLIDVWDKSEEPPVAQVPGLDTEGGRGLFLVAAVCERWGWYHARRGGKVVWAELAVA